MRMVLHDNKIFSKTAAAYRRLPWERRLQRLIYMLKIVHYRWHELNNRLSRLSSKEINGKGMTWPAYLYSMHKTASKLGRSLRSEANILPVVPSRVVHIGMVEVDLFQFSSAKVAAFDEAKSMVESLCFDSPAILDVGRLVDCASVRELNYRLMANNDQHALYLLNIILNNVTLRRRLVSAVSANGVC